MDKVVFTNGCFDILHRGHYELLKYCKTLGNVIVGLNSDESVKRLKGQQRPINTQEDRKFALECCKYVDQVIIFEEDTPYETIKLLKPDVLVKGGDYIMSDIVGTQHAKETIIFDYVKGYSTTETIKNIGDR